LGGNCTSPTYTYDGANRLTSTGGYTYSYDADGRRNKQANGSSGMAYFYDPAGNVLTESDLSNNIQNEYVFFNGMRVARIDVIGGKHYYFHDAGLGVSASRRHDSGSTAGPTSSKKAVRIGLAFYLSAVIQS
jgi:hypothetical protein